MFGNIDLTTLIANVPALLIGFAFHEFAHAWAADKMGDPTPRSQGRLTLNPLVHLDLFGTIMALLFRFGWAKPVQINPQYFRGNPIRARMLVALAGPLINLLIAFIATILLLFTAAWDSIWTPVLTQVIGAIVFMNLGLGIFNLLPVPPLDGFAVLGGLLPRRMAIRLYMLEPYGMIILMIVLLTNIATYVLLPVINIIWQGYLAVGQIFVRWVFGV